MGQTFSDYLYYDINTKEIKDNIFFNEDCLITSFETKKDFEPILETINEENELLFENSKDNPELDALSKDYVKKIFLIAKKELDSGEVNKKENFDILYPIRLTKSDNESKSFYDNEYYNLKEDYKTLELDHKVLKKNYESLKISYDALNKNYKRAKTSTIKYKFD